MTAALPGDDSELFALARACVDAHELASKIGLTIKPLPADAPAWLLIGPDQVSFC